MGTGWRLWLWGFVRPSGRGVGTIGLHTWLPDAGAELGEVGSHQVLRQCKLGPRHWWREGQQERCVTQVCRKDQRRPRTVQALVLAGLALGVSNGSLGAEAAGRDPTPSREQRAAEA